MPSCAALAKGAVPPSVVVVTSTDSPYQPPRSGQKRAHPLRRLTRRATPARGRNLDDVVAGDQFRVWGVSAPDAPTVEPLRELSVTFHGHATIETTDDDDLRDAVPGNIVCIDYQTGHLVIVQANTFYDALAGMPMTAIKFVGEVSARSLENARRCVVGRLIRKRPRSIDVFVDPSSPREL